MEHTILLVEDEAIIAIAEEMTLRRNGYEVLIAKTGEQAVEVASESNAIDLVLMDIDLGQGMTGTEAAQTILKRRSLPLVFLSSHTEPEIVDLTEGITSYGYIVKNSGETVLLASIRMAYRLFEAHRTVSEQNRQIAESNRELRRTNDELRWWDHIMHDVVEYDPSAIAILDDGLRFMYVSSRWKRDYGLPDEEMIGRHHYEVFPEIPQRWREVHRRALAGEVLRAEEDRFTRPDGSVDEVRWECRPWYRSNGSIGGIILYTEVLTRQRRIARELRESEKRFRTIMDAMEDVVFTVDAQGRHTGVYGRWLDKYGFSSADYLGKTFAEVLGAELARIHEQALAKALRGTFTIYDWSVPSPAGETHFQTSLSPIKDDDGAVDGAVGVGRDISDLVRARQELLRASELEAAIVTASPFPIIGIDPDGFVTSWNPAAEAIFGWSREEVLGRLLPTVPRHDDDTFAALRQRVLAGEVITAARLTRITRDGTLLSLTLSAAPIRDPDGRVVGIVGFMVPT